MACTLGERIFGKPKVKGKLDLRSGPEVDITSPGNVVFCPYVDGQQCRPKCPLYGETVITTWVIEKNRRGEVEPAKVMKSFKGCLRAAAMISECTLANEKF